MVLWNYIFNEKNFLPRIIWRFEMGGFYFIKRKCLHCFYSNKLKINRFNHFKPQKKNKLDNLDFLDK